MTIKGKTNEAYAQRKEADRNERLAMPPTRDWKPLTVLPKAPYQRPTYSAPGCVIRSRMNAHETEVLA